MSSMHGQDPFGSAILDHHRGQHAHSCMIERDDGVNWQEPILPYFESKDDWKDEEKEALSDIGSRVLDIGCGVGRHVLTLQKKALAVGLDISGTVLRVLRERGGKNLVLGSSRRLPFRRDSFDTVLLMSNGLGISGDVEGTTEMLVDAKRVLSCRGSLIAHTTDPMNPESGIDSEFVARNRKANRPGGLLRVRIRYRGVVGGWFELMLLTPEEVRAILKRTGFNLKRSIDWGASQLYSAVPD